MEDVAGCLALTFPDFDFIFLVSLILLHRDVARVSLSQPHPAKAVYSDPYFPSGKTREQVVWPLSPNLPPDEKEQGPQSQSGLHTLDGPAGQTHTMQIQPHWLSTERTLVL